MAISRMRLPKQLESLVDDIRSAWRIADRKGDVTIEVRVLVNGKVHKQIMTQVDSSNPSISA